jgi:minor extracellular serine protease Vpr
MKHNYSLIKLSAMIIAMHSMSLIAQNAAKAKLSAFTQQFMHNTNSSSVNKTKGATAVYKKIENGTFLSALIKVTPSANDAQFAALNVKIGTKAGNIWTVQIPENKFNDFISINGIEYIQLDEAIHPNLDMARKTTRVDSVHKGISLPMPYTGKNVVVGILDVGLDYTHPAFYDTLGNKYRIKRVWEQKSTGTPPAGFSYGKELTDSLSIVTDGTDNVLQTHGTHVAGIAAGSGYGSATSGKYRGVAFESDIVMVGITPPSSQWTSAGMSDIIDGINYVYTYAASVGKPAVVNLSWGCTVGPHDGTSLFSQACDNLTGAGKLFVVSAGNNGTNNVHVKKDFLVTDSLLKTVVNFSTYLPEKKTWLDIWGDVSKTFEVKLALYNATTLTSETRLFTLNNTTLDTFIVGSVNDTCYFKLTAIASDYNLKPHVLLDVYSKTANNLCLTIKAKNGRVHAWEGYVKESSGYYGSFTTGGITGAIAGDVEYTIGEMACTNSAITIGAYASKVSYVDLAGGSWSYNTYVNVNKIVPFSSHGPTTDNRTKPEITAPGLTIASSVSSFDTAYSATGSSKTNIVRTFINPLNGKSYYYGEMSGTSMSSPMATGIVALLLQVNPLFTPQQIKNILAQTAIKDTYTTATPNATIWGAGKINAYQAIKEALIQTGINDRSYSVNSNLEMYPNPNNGHFIIEKIGVITDPITIEVRNTAGVVVFSKNNVSLNNQHQLEIILPELSSGIYFTTVSTVNTSSILKMVIIRN